jgi:hypothetical protein
MLTACQAAGQPGNTEVFGPGDRIDGMSLTTGATNAAPLLAFCSPAQQSGYTTISDCHVPLLPKLAIGQIFMLADDSFSGLDWSELSWQFFMDDRAVDLESFGTYDFVVPTLLNSRSPIREVFTRSTAWDVVLTNLTPGEHTLRGLAQAETDSYSWIVNLTIEASDPETGMRWTGIQKVS